MHQFTNIKKKMTTYKNKNKFILIDRYYNEEILFFPTKLGYNKHFYQQVAREI